MHVVHSTDLYKYSLASFDWGREGEEEGFIKSLALLSLYSLRPSALAYMDREFCRCISLSYDLPGIAEMELGVTDLFTFSPISALPLYSSIFIFANARSMFHHRDACCRTRRCVA
jgi:hypothetical protein